MFGNYCILICHAIASNEFEHVQAEDPRDPKQDGMDEDPGRTRTPSGDHIQGASERVYYMMYSAACVCVPPTQSLFSPNFNLSRVLHMAPIWPAGPLIPLKTLGLPSSELDYMRGLFQGLVECK